MKKMIVSTIIFSCFSFLYGMEDNNKVLQLSYNTVPPICLIKDNIYKREFSMAASITVAGLTEQGLIEGFNVDIVAGDWFKSNNNGVSLLDPTFEKYFNYVPRFPKEPRSIILEGKRFNITDISATDKISREPVPGILILIVEPMINTAPNDDKSYAYTPHRNVTMEDNRTLKSMNYFYGQHAFEEAEKDLKLCYTNLLDGAYIMFIKDEKNRSIAFPPLSTLLGISHDKAAKIAVATVLEFIKNSINKDKYSEIQFVVKKQEDFNAYKKLLDELLS
jgi:hypothetical protein